MITPFSFQNVNISKKIHFRCGSKLAIQEGASNLFYEFGTQHRTLDIGSWCGNLRDNLASHSNGTHHFTQNSNSIPIISQSLFTRMLSKHFWQHFSWFIGKMFNFWIMVVKIVETLTRNLSALEHDCHWWTLNKKVWCIVCNERWRKRRERGHLHWFFESELTSD